MRAEDLRRRKSHAVEILAPAQLSVGIVAAPSNPGEQISRLLTDLENQRAILISRRRITLNDGAGLRELEAG